MTAEQAFDEISNISSDEQFNELAIEIFEYQAKHLPVYRKFIDLLEFDVSSVNHYSEIPFLPIEFFKSEKVIIEGLEAQQIFKSSGTTGENRSTHRVHSSDLYRRLSIKAFESMYGNPRAYTFLAVLPTYAERTDSSLVFMISEFMKLSPEHSHGFFMNDQEKLLLQLELCQQRGEQVILVGVTFALLDLADKGTALYPNVVVMETGGMKGRREEIIREELHQILKTSFKVSSIHSEYGMTELLSQAYSKGGGVFYSPDWMKVIIRDVNDPFSYCKKGKTGGINVIDLGNVFSCSFIATQDLGRAHIDGGFEVLGRFDNAEVRGCNLLSI